MEIKRCPFCGKSEDIKEMCTAYSDGVLGFIHFCSGYTVNAGVSISIHGNTVEDVISLWNGKIQTEAVD